MSIEHIYVENEIRSFVYRIFGLFDKHVPVEEILQYLVDDPLEMEFPGAPIRSAQEFRHWYANVELACEWNVHNIEKIDVTLGGHGRYEVAVSLRWQALSAERIKSMSIGCNRNGAWSMAIADRRLHDIL